MRINAVGEDGFQASFVVDEDTGEVSLVSGSRALKLVQEDAQGAIGGDPLWAGPVEHIRNWADERGYTLEEVDVPELVSDPGVVY